jgi:hypothetical protein
MGARTEEIRGAIANMGEEALADALALLLGEGSAQIGVEAAGSPEFDNFAQAVQYLKRRYGFPELVLFSTEADLVYVMTDGRRVLLTDRDDARRVEPRRRLESLDEPEYPRENTAKPVAASTVDGKAAPPTEPKEEAGRFSHLEL